MNLAIALVSLGAALAAAVAALGSWKAASHATRLTAQMAALERDRRWEELRPEFSITATVQGTAPDHANLHVALSGRGTDSLDDVSLTILDESGVDHWAHGLPEGVSVQEARAFVWGPWEFNPAATAQVLSNRESRPRSFSRADGRNWDLLDLRRTRPGTWMTGTDEAAWQRERSGPLRLQLVCRQEGYVPWVLLYEVQVDDRTATVSTSSSGPRIQRRR